MGEITCCRYEDFVKALADETRQAILELLQQGETNVGEMAACFDQTQPTISYHLGLLRRAGLVVARSEGKQVYYTVNRCCLEKCTGARPHWVGSGRAQLRRDRPGHPGRGRPGALRRERPPSRVVGARRLTSRLVAAVRFFSGG